jgi:hypothetical protein
MWSKNSRRIDPIIRSLDIQYAHRRHPIAEGPAVGAVAIANEELRRFVPGESFGDLLGRPLGRWIRSERPSVDHGSGRRVQRGA